MTTGYTSATIAYAWPDEDDAESDDWITVSQPEEADDDASSFTEWVSDNGYTLSLTNAWSLLDAYYSECDGEGVLEREIRVERSRDDLNYTIEASYGELGECVQAQGEVCESVLIEGETSIELEAEIDGEFSYEWESCNVEPEPEVSYDGTTISWGGAEIVGSLRYSFNTTYDKYILTITPRDEYDEEDRSTAYEASIFVEWDGDPVTHDVELPSMIGNCSGGVSVSSGGDDDDDDDELCYERTITVDPCTKEVLSDELTVVDCPEDE